MKNLLPVFIAVLLLFGMLPGQVLPSAVGHHDHGVAVSQDQNHHHLNSMPGLHCSVSSACAPVFGAVGDVALSEVMSNRIIWNFNQVSVLSGHASEMDPPVPRA